MDTKEFVEKSKKVHGGKYDYSSSIYTFSKNKIKILCKEHGFFDQIASSHLNGNGCKKCGSIKSINSRKMTFEKFLRKSAKVHGSLYDYSKCNFIDYKKKVNIICKKHGCFKVLPENFLSGRGCPKCVLEKTAYNRRLTSVEFVRRAKNIHGGFYDYSLVLKNIRCENNVKIICPKHGIYEQNIHSHLQGRSCPHCGLEKIGNKKRLDKDGFVHRAQKIHGNKYDYSQVDYLKSSKKVKIICPIHGSFFVTPSSHFSGHGCALCSFEKLSQLFRYSSNDFIKKSRIIHNDIYNYSSVVYKNINEKVVIICNKHGDFYQSPKKHLAGQGCPMCRASVGEKIIFNFLKENKIFFIKNKFFKKCRNKKLLPFDFFIPSLNTCIEYDGVQHFMPVSLFGGGRAFEEQQRRDKIKTDFCLKNNIKLIRVKYRRKNEIKHQLKEILCQK